MLNEEVIERIVSHFPNLKVIFLARDPRRASMVAVIDRCAPPEYQPV
jgi:hypothetical protein